MYNALAREESTLDALSDPPLITDAPLLWGLKNTSLYISLVVIIIGHLLTINRPHKIRIANELNVHESP